MSEQAAVSSPLASQHGSLSTALNVIKRDGQLFPYTDSKIAIAITKAILAVEGQSASGEGNGGCPGDRYHRTFSQASA